MSKKKQAPEASEAVKPAVPVGVYVNHNRSTAIVVRCLNGVVWFLNMVSGKIALDCVSVDRFKHNFTQFLPDYPVLRAVRKYATSNLDREEKTDKVMQLILRRANVE